MAKIFKTLSSLWNYLREVSGENDYSRYCRRAVAQGYPPLGPREFYLLKLQQKYSRPCRCC